MLSADLAFATRQWFFQVSLPIPGDSTFPKSISRNNNDDGDAHNLPRACYILGTLHILPLVLKALKGSYYHLHFAHEETEAQAVE